jgi:hypothetical protein
MTIAVVGCGNSAKDWHKTPYDYSVGVNDCLKFGQHPNTLILVNAPFKFQPTKENGHQNRLATIKQTKPREVITNDRGLWSKFFDCQVEEVRMQQFWKPELFKKGNYYYSKTSPFIAINYAYNIGADKIMIWGVDFTDHPNFPRGKRHTEFELENYAALIGLIQAAGVEVYIGNKNTALNQFLEVYKP